MKVWITKYALTDGLIERDVRCCKFGGIYGIWDDGKRCGSFDEGEWFLDKQSAIQKAKEMRQKKIASLKKQIEKLERMRFE